MILIVGLGNPGKKYAKTRHSLGFRVVDEFRKESNFPKFKFSKELSEGPAKGGGVMGGLEPLISKGKFNNEKIILAKPQTFMNESGKAIKTLLSTLPGCVAGKSLWVIHDDIDLPLGKIRISIGRGAAGHKGVQSIIDTLKTKGFIRFRIGIMNHQLRIKKREKFVLKKFRKKEEKIVKEIIKKTIEALEFSLEKGLERSMTQFNK